MMSDRFGCAFELACEMNKACIHDVGSNYGGTSERGSGTLIVRDKDIKSLNVKPLKIRAPFTR